VEEKDLVGEVVDHESLYVHGDGDGDVSMDQAGPARRYHVRAKGNHDAYGCHDRVFYRDEAWGQKVPIRPIAEVGKDQIHRFGHQEAVVHEVSD